MKICLGRVPWSAILAVAFVTPKAFAAPCSEVGATKAIYGSGGSAVTPTLKNVATALASLDGDEKVTVFYNDPGACIGYGYFRNPDPLIEVSFRYWDETGLEATCEAPQNVIQFAHMGNTPALCPGDVPLLEGQQKFVAPVQTINVITHWNSRQRSISAEALYHIFGFGPGASGRVVTPWDELNAVFVRRTNSFVHQIVAGSVAVPGAAFRLPEANFKQTNGEIVRAVYEWGNTADPEESLGYVSGSNATEGEDEEQIRTLAYQHFDQTCSYLPDSSLTRRDKINVRTGQYWLWTPAWFYTQVDNQGNPTNTDVAKLIGWFDGSIEGPGGIDVQSIVIESGDIPLCAMQAVRPEGDLSAIQSYAPARPCNGWFEFVATGSTDYQVCTTSSQCDGEDEICRFGFCEAH